MRFFMQMPIPSVTAQVKRCRIVNGKPVFFDGARIKAARDAYMLKLKDYAPASPIEKGAPVSLTVVFNYKATKTHIENEYKTTRPDTDNMIKLLKDCMTATGFWHDDAQVAEEHVCKKYCKYEGIYISVKALPKYRA